jgi:Zn-dependent peptidase ImmA (M78 family)
MATSTRARIILIDPRAMDPRMIVGIAHELGHVVSGKAHDPAHQEENELDANFRAVAILVIGEGTSEEAAFRQIRDLLAAIATVRAKHGNRAPATTTRAPKCLT